MNLTDEQRSILNHHDACLYISAAPGSGKSSVLSLLCSKILKSNENNHALLITFTNKASKSIIEKCKDVNQEQITGGTFHGLAYRSMIQNGLKFHICDEYKKEVIIRKLFDCKKDKNKLERIYEHITELKSQWPLDVEDEFVKNYQDELAKYNLLDFDDIIYKFIELTPGLMLPNISHILVDELQDTSGPQLEMLKTLQKRFNSKVIGVADDDQLLYRWRNARPENIQDFIKTFNCKTLNMGYNFRSAIDIVEKSVNLIEHNKQRIQKVIKPARDEGGIVAAYQCNSPLEEINYIISKCQQNRGKEIAILYRNRVYKNHLELELKRSRIPYVVNDMFELTDRSAVKCVMSTLKIATNNYDIYDLEQASKALKGIGKTTILKIEEESKEKPFPEVIEQWNRDPKKRKKFSSILNIQSFFNANQGATLDNLVRFSEDQFINSFDFQEDMRNFLLDITKEYKINTGSIRDLYNELGLDSREKERNDDALVELSTVHGYKGLQAPIIIVPWVQQFTPKTPDELEDERRCFYVAITRAESKLYMSYSGDKPQFIREMWNEK